MTDTFNASLTAIKDCAAYCDICAASCIKEDMVEQMRECILNCLDCADICRLAASYLARKSPSTIAICRACAEVCARCAAECETHGADHCRACAKACRAAEAECRAIA